MDLISIIVPIYKVEEYLEECIQSLVVQTYENLEIILVDDGSTDSCGEICDRWAKKDQRICVIHKENGGLSDARNAGMKVAKGEWIGFVDSDDVIHPKMYETLLTMMKKTNSDIGCCNLTRDLHSCRIDCISVENSMEDIHENTQLLYKNDASGIKVHDRLRLFDKQKCQDEKKWQQFSSVEALESLLRQETITVTVWNKLYKKETIGGLEFPKGKYHEDEFWTYLVLNRAKRVVYTDMPYYGYRERGESITTQKYTSRHLDFLDGRSKRLEYMEKHYPQFKGLERTNLRFECIRSMQLCLIHMEGDELKNCRKRVYKIVKRYPLKYKDYKNLPLGRQIWCMLSNITFDGTCKIRNRFHYGP